VLCLFFAGPRDRNIFRAGNGVNQTEEAAERGCIILGGVGKPGTVSTKLKRPLSGGCIIWEGLAKRCRKKGEFGEREEGRSQLVDFDESQ